MVSLQLGKYTDCNSKNSDGSIQVFRLPLELEYWVLSCMYAASTGRNPFPCKVAFGIIDTKFHVDK